MCGTTDRVVLRTQLYESGTAKTTELRYDVWLHQLEETVEVNVALDTLLLSSGEVQRRRCRME